MKLNTKAIQKIKDFGISAIDFSKQLSIASENMNSITSGLNELKKHNWKVKKAKQ